MYQALYRKWRPRTFDDVVGQAHITETLKRQVAAGRLSHAYLFTGTRGTGKTSCAKILARAVNCEHPVNGNPCNQCPACLGIENGSILDVLELDAASNNGVDQVRALRDEAVYTPAAVRKRVYIVDEVHNLSPAAFNALLKIMEEPPAHLMFILATTELHKVPATIRSRCQQFAFKRILPGEIAGRLDYVAKQEGLDLSPEGAALLSRLADGALRDGVSLLDQCASAFEGTLTEERVCAALGLAGEQNTAALLTAVADHDARRALELFSSLYAAGKDLSAMLEELLSLSRDLLILKAAPESGMAMLSGVAGDQEAKALLGRFTAEELLRITSVLQETAAGFSKSANRRIDAELCLLRLTQPALDENLQSLTARVSKLESRLASGQFTPAKAPEPEEELPPPPDDFDAPPAPEAAPPAPQEAPGGFWPDLAARLRQDLPGKFKGFFSVEGPVRAHLDGELLNLVAESDFAKKVVDCPEVVETAARIAAELLGRPVRVHCIKRGQKVPGGENDPMRALLTFGQEHTDIINIKK